MKIKRYLNLLAVMSVFAACQNETDILDAPLKGAEVTIEAAREGIAGSRTTLTEEYKINWHESDKLSVFLGSDVNQPFTIHEGAGTDYATFKGTGDIFITGGSESSAGAFANVAYYPYSEGVQVAQGTDGAYTITASLPSNQTYRQGSFGQDAYHMVAVAESNRDYAFTFKNVGSMFMLYLKGSAEITKIELESQANKLAGASTITAAYGEEPSIILDANSAESKITLDCMTEVGEGVTKGVQLSDAESTVFVISVPPIAGDADDLTFTIYDANYGYMVYKNAAAYSVARNQYYTFGATTAVEYKATGYTQDYVQDANGNVKIYTAAGLKRFRDEVNNGTSFVGKTIELEADINLNNEEWTPIVVVENGNLRGATFDGKNHVISNYKVTASTNTQNAGLFGYVVSATLKNFTVYNAQILYPDDYTGDAYGAAVLGCGYVMTLENITVDNSKIQGNNKVGGLMARHCENAKLTVTNCHVKNSTIESKNDTDGGNVGGLIGYIDLGNAETNVITNSSVTRCTINAVNSSNTGKRANGQFVACVNSTNAAKLIITGCKVENNIYNEETTTYISPFDGLLVGGERSTKTCTVVIDGKEYPIKPVQMNGQGFDTIQEAITAIVGDNATIKLAAGTYTLPTSLSGLNLVIEGEGLSTDVVVDMSNLNGTPQYGAKKVTFKNLTMKRNSGPYYGLSHSGEEHFVGCIVEGTLVTYAPVVTAKETVFKQTSKDLYNVHIYSSGKMEFDGCSFVCEGKSVYMHHDTNASEYNVVIKNSTFTANQKVVGKAAIQMHTEYGVKGTLTIVGNTTATGFDTSINGGLWNELKNDGSGILTDNFIKTVDGKVYVQTQTGLQSAIDATTAEIEIVMANDIALTSNTKANRVSIPAGKKITLSGINEDITYTGTFMVTGELYMKNLELVMNSAVSDETVSQFSKTGVSLQNNGFVSCENVDFTLNLDNATAITSWWATGDGANIEVKECTFDCNGQRPIRSGSSVTVDGCTFNDPYRYAVQMTSKSSTMDAEAKAVVNFKGNTINAGTTSDKPVYGVQLEGEEYGCYDLTINGSNNTINLNNTGKSSAMYYCECGKVDHSTVVWNTEVEPVHAE